MIDLAVSVSLRESSAAVCGERLAYGWSEIVV